MNILTRAAAGCVASAMLFAVTTAAADPAPAAALAGNTTPCDRACLRDIAETYLRAMLAHTPAKAPLALNARYTKRLRSGPGQTACGARSISSAPTGCTLRPDDRMIGFLAKGTENGAPVLIGTRLRVINHQITEMESVVARLSSTLGGSSLGPPKDASIDGEPRKAFTTDLPPASRLTAAQLGAIVNGYFTGLEGNHGDQPPAFAEDCHRLENETPTTNVTPAAGAEPGAASFPCAKAFGLGYYREDTRLRNRRIMAVDTERGLVYAGVFFDHDATVRAYKLKDGREVKVRNTGPWTWMIKELFEVNAAGKISQVEAVLLSVPYGMRPNWVTGTHFPSPQAKLDHFREY